MTKPITPKEIGSTRKLPRAVLDAINECIQTHWDGSSAEILQKDIIAAIMRHDKTLVRDDLFVRGYLNFEPVYRRAGWNVEYDKPAYNETYEPYFTFTEK